jgi:hypothetical protein
MPDGPIPTPPEETLLRMLADSGSPQAAGRDLVGRLEALEAEIAALEAAVNAGQQEEGEAPPPDGGADGEPV